MLRVGELEKANSLEARFAELAHEVKRGSELPQSELLARIDGLQGEVNELKRIAGKPGPQGPPGPAGQLPVVKEYAAGRVHYQSDVVTHVGALWQARGGSADSMSLAIGHKEDDIVVVDALREIKPPFNPESVVGEFSALLISYRISTITGDRYAGDWPRERFREHGISYEPAQKSKSDLYRDLLPAINSRKLDLLDDARLLTQLVSLERRTARGGRDSIDHARGSGSLHRLGRPRARTDAECALSLFC